MEVVCKLDTFRRCNEKVISCVDFLSNSTDTIYHVTFSVHRNKTHISFTSSNSSFQECVRNHLSEHSLFSSFSSQSNSACSPSPIEDQQFSNENCTYSSGSHTFIDCSWNNTGRTNTGCAIYFVRTTTDSTASLSVTRCSFFHCHSSGSVGGGGICVNQIGSAHISESIFFDCSCGSYNSLEGGGIMLSRMYTQPFIQTCTFISCSSCDDGGGCAIYYSNSSLTYVINSCPFIKCKGVDKSSSQGGGFLVYSNKHFIACTNCAFYACDAPHQGGGIWIDLPSGTTMKRITFCFFHENQSGSGRDIYFRDFSSSTQAIIHCFSFESTTGRVFGGQDTWLPQGSIYFLNLSTLQGTVTIYRSVQH